MTQSSKSITLDEYDRDTLGYLRAFPQIGEATLRRVEEALLRGARRDAELAEVRARVEALHPKIENPTHGCCAPPKLCAGHRPACGGREHGLGRPDWPCDTVRALGA